MTIASKTQSIISRFPDFYQADASDTLFVRFVDVFGQTLEGLEADLLRVMRAHWIETAGNEGSRGFDTAQKGDLDKIFAFYLENLGGTSQLKQVNWHFVPQDFIDLSGLVDRLRRAADPFSRYLQAQFSAETRRLLAEHLFVRGEVTLTRPAAERRLVVPSNTRLSLTWQSGPLAGQELEFVTVATAELPYQVHSTAVTVQALTPGSRYEVTSRSGVAWQLRSDDPQLAALTVDTPQPLRVQTPALRQALVDDLNRILETPFYDRQRFGDLPLAPEIQELVQQNLPSGSRRLARLNYAVLEAAYAGLIRKSYAAYRERLKGVIQVLQGGASTVEGIRNIVAVNLGIIGDDPAAVAAREEIRVIEFLPVSTTTLAGQDLKLGQPFVLENLNPVDIHPRIRVRLSAELAGALVDVRLENLTSGQTLHVGETLYRNDELLFLPDGQTLLNGVPLEPGRLSGAIPALPPGTSTWRIGATVDLARAAFDETLYDTSFFEQGRPNDVTLAEWDAERQALEQQPAIATVHVVTERLTPGAFTVRIPWDIPGFTDKFAEFGDHPRHQIRYIIERVKAAGVFTAIVYEKLFTETHAQDEALFFEGRLHQAEAHPAEADFSAHLTHTPAQPEGGEQHELAEDFAVSGVFSHTYLNQSFFWNYPAARFDETHFDRTEFGLEDAVLNETAFNEAEFGAAPGAFDQTMFDQSEFDAPEGQFDTTSFDLARFPLETGRLDETRFDKAGFDIDNQPTPQE